MKAGDIVIVHGRGWTARWIRRLTRSRGEAPTRATHVGVAVSSTHVVEALWRGVVKRPYVSGQLYRQVNLLREDVHAIVEYAEAQVGKKYGYWKIALQALDGLLGGRYVFRRLGFITKEPICSRLLADAWAAAGYSFGVVPKAATPDDIEDALKANPMKFRQVLEDE